MAKKSGYEVYTTQNNIQMGIKAALKSGSGDKVALICTKEDCQLLVKALQSHREQTASALVDEACQDFLNGIQELMKGINWI